jgi:hypothetical protein
MSKYIQRESNLRKLLRAGRLRSSLRQIDVAKTLGKPQSYIAKVENGERQLSFIETLDFCDAIKLDAHELVDKLTKE